MAERPASEPSIWLVEEWARQLTHVLESMMGEAPCITYAPQTPSEMEAAPDQKEMLWWEQRFSIGSDAPVWAGASAKSWEEIGNRVLRSAGVEDADRDSMRGTYLEIVQQALAGVAGSLSARAGREVGCVAGREAAPPATPDTASFAFEISMGDALLPVMAVFSRSLADPAASVSETSIPQAAERPQPQSVKPASGTASPIDLLLDVELPVSISFGRAQLPLKDIIKLTTGCIVELNRAVSEPVDVIVNNCVIARGEVVVVEGNFGIRIRQVISRQERLRTLY